MINYYKSPFNQSTNDINLNLSRSNNDNKTDAQNPESIQLNKFINNFTGNATPSKFEIKTNKTHKNQNEGKVDVPQIKISIKDITNNFESPNLEKNYIQKNDSKIFSTGIKRIFKGDPGNGYVIRFNQIISYLLYIRTPEILKKGPSTVILDYSNLSPDKSIQWDINTKALGSVSTTKNAANKRIFGMLLDMSSNKKHPMTPDNFENKSFSTKKTPTKQKNEFYERVIDKIFQKDLDDNTRDLYKSRSNIKQKVRTSKILDNTITNFPKSLMFFVLTLH